MPALDLIRQHDVLKVEQYQSIPIHIIGAGALGSRIWLNMVEIGLENISLYDFDKVESHNLANQIFLAQDVGKYKVDAAKDYWKLKTGMPVPDNMHFINGKVELSDLNSDWNGPTEGIVIMAVDNMDTRKHLFSTMKNFDKIILIVDVRMASSYGNVFTINTSDPIEKNLYKESIFPDEDGEVSPCGTQISIGPTANAIASIATWQVINTLDNITARDHRINIFLQPFTAATERVQYYDKETKSFLPY